MDSHLFFLQSPRCGVWGMCKAVSFTYAVVGLLPLCRGNCSVWFSWSTNTFTAILAPAHICGYFSLRTYTHYTPACHWLHLSRVQTSVYCVSGMVRPHLGRPWITTWNSSLKAFTVGGLSVFSSIVSGDLWINMMGNGNMVRLWKTQISFPWRFFFIIFQCSGGGFVIWLQLPWQARYVATATCRRSVFSIIIYFPPFVTRLSGGFNHPWRTRHVITDAWRCSCFCLILFISLNLYSLHFK